MSAFLRDLDNQYRLYFSYCPNSTILDSTCGTYSAISMDALNFTVEPGIRMDAISEPIIDPAVLYFNSEWHYSAPIQPPNGGGARHATSSDGLNFTLIDSMGQGNTHYQWTGNFMDNDSTIRFYGFSDNVLGNYLWWAESIDGSNWSSCIFTNITGKDPAVLKLNSGSYLLLVPKSISPLSYESLTNESHTKASLLKISNLLGKDTKPKRNTPLFYIYDDGTVDKHIIVE